MTKTRLEVARDENGLTKAYEIARQNPGKGVVLGSSQTDGTTITVGGRTPYPTSAYKDIFGSEGFSW